MSLKYNIVKQAGTCVARVRRCLFGEEWRETDLNGEESGGCVCVGGAGHHQIHHLRLNSSSQSQSQLCSLLTSLHIFCLAADSESSPILLWQESKCEVIWGDLCERGWRERGTGRGSEPLRSGVTIPAWAPLSHGQAGNCRQAIHAWRLARDSCITVNQLSPRINVFIPAARTPSSFGCNSLSLLQPWKPEGTNPGRLPIASRVQQREKDYKIEIKVPRQTFDNFCNTVKMAFQMW